VFFEKEKKLYEHLIVIIIIIYMSKLEIIKKNVYLSVKNFISSASFFLLSNFPV